MYRFNYDLTTIHTKSNYKISRLYSGQQLVSQLQNQNPELFNSLRQQMGGTARPGAGDGSDGTPPNNQPQQPPPSQ